MPKGREYCCCAIPLVNAGIYATLVEQTALGITVGILSVGTRSIVGSSAPSFSSLILGIIAFVAAGVQVLGFIGVWREKSLTYRRYVTLHGIVTLLAFSIAATWIILSVVGHDKAKQRCVTNFFNSASDSTSQEGDALCNIFSWVTVGVMGGLWLMLAIVQVYLFIVLSSYGKNQRHDHDQYNRVNDGSLPLKTESIPLDSEPWDSGKQRQGYRHLRQESAASVSDIMSQPFQQPKDTMSISYENYDPQRIPYPPESHRRIASESLVPNDNISSNVDDSRDLQGPSQYVEPRHTTRLPSKY